MNPTHISDELPRLLTGEANRDTVLSAGAHLRGCVDCQDEMVSAVVAHAALTSARRFAPEVVAPTSDEARASIARHAIASEPVHPVPDRAAELPDLSAVFAQVRKEVGITEDGDDDEAERPTDELAKRRGRRSAYLLGAAAAAVVIGAGAGVYALSTGGTHAPAGREVALAAYDKGTVGASARVGNGTISVDAASLPTLTGKRYEVWLTNQSRTRLQPIGWIGSNGTATLTVPNTLMQQYRDLEVSVQSNNAKDYSYSGTSVLRGSLS